MKGIEGEIRTKFSRREEGRRMSWETEEKEKKNVKLMDGEGNREKTRRGRQK